MSFFHSLPFGIFALAIVGGSWCLTGLVMGNAPKHRIATSELLRMGSFVSCLASLLIYAGTRATGAPPPALKATLLTCLCYFAASMVNSWMLQVMSHAMQKGPNGIIWCIIQSAMIFPFLGGILIFHQPAHAIQFLGMFLLLIALLQFGLAKDNTVAAATAKPSFWTWKRLAFLAFLITGVQQNLGTAPSYFEEARQVTPVLRTFAAALGTITGATIWSLFAREPSPLAFQKATLKRGIFWKYIVILQGFGLIFAYTLFYPGLDILARHGLGGMGYPLMVGACIVAFTFSSLVVLKEKLRARQLAAIALCVIGLVLLCWK